MQRLIRFGIVGGAGVVWKTLFLIFFVEAIGINEELAVFPTAILVLLHNYELNRLWTFRDRRIPRSWVTFRNYAASNGFSLIIYFSAFFVLNFMLHYVIASITAVLIASISNYLLANKVFKANEEF